MAHFVDAGRLCGNGETEFVRLGKDLEEYTVNMEADTEQSSNILGESTFHHGGYSVSAESDTYYARVNDTLFERLQEIVDGEYQDDRCKTTAVEVHLWNENAVDGSYPAYRQQCYIVPASFGGDTSGYNIPFTVNYIGELTKGVYNLSDKEFRSYKAGILGDTEGEAIQDIDGNTIETSLNVLDTDML